MSTNEQLPDLVRSGRFYMIDGNWYFFARNYQDQGPFSSKDQAEKALQKFLNNLEYFEATKENENFACLKLIKSY